MTPGFLCYANNVIHSLLTKKKITVMPYNFCPEKSISVAVHFPMSYTINREDTTLNEALVILGHSLKGVYSVYAKKNVFTEPEIIFKPEQRSLLVKIGIMSKERYKIIKKRSMVKS